MSEIKDIVLNGISYNLSSQTGAGLTEDIKQALLACFENVAWIDDDGADYYNALQATLYPPNGLVSISAVYTQSGAVYSVTPLDSLKDDLVVTALYDDSTSETVSQSDYVLSGTLPNGGTGNITVTYGGKTATFTVTTTHTPVYPLANGTHSFTSTNRSLTVTNGNHIEYTNSSASISGTGAYLNLMDVSDNDTSGTSNSNYDRTTTWFTIPNGSSYAFKLKNISITALNSTASSVFLDNRTTALIHSGDFSPSQSTDIVINGTATQDMNITVLGAYVRNSWSALSFDVELIVDGVRYI